MPLAGLRAICEPTEQGLASVMRKGEVFWLDTSSGAESVGVADGLLVDHTQLLEMVRP